MLLSIASCVHIWYVPFGVVIYTFDCVHSLPSSCSLVYAGMFSPTAIFQTGGLGVEGPNRASVVAVQSQEALDVLRVEEPL